MPVPLAYFAPVSLISHFLVDGQLNCTERYVKQSVRNRCLILAPNGVQRLTVPVKAYPNHALTTDVLIDYTQPWQMRHWRALNSAYRNAPYFDYFADEVRALILPEVPFEKLADLNTASLKLALRLMGLGQPESRDTHEPEHQTTPWDRADRPFGTQLNSKPYHQVWADRFAFEPDLSCLDLIFCTGPRSKPHLLDI